MIYNARCNETHFTIAVYAHSTFTAERPTVIAISASIAGRFEGKGEREKEGERKDPDDFSAILPAPRALPQEADYIYSRVIEEAVVHTRQPRKC